VFKSCAVSLMLAMAITSVSAAANDEPQAGGDKEKLICKSEKVTGSRLKKRRTCLTRQQWDDLATETKQDLDRFTTGASSAAPSGGNAAAPQ
jgi:hypothetical protein